MAADPAQDQPDDAPHDAMGYLALSGTVVADPHFLARLGTAAWLCRAVYNAAIDSHVPFADGVLHALEASRARREGREPPPAPARAVGVVNRAEFGPRKKELTHLIPLVPEMAGFGRSMLDEALREACDAVAEHRKRCAQAKRDGTKTPTLHRRRASDAWVVTMADFKLHRIGDGEPRKAPKARHVTGTTRRNRRRHEDHKAERELAWAEEKRRCGWSEKRIAARLATREARHERDRRQGDVRQTLHEADARQAEAARVVAREAERAAAAAQGREPARLPPDRVRRDSPRATMGERRMKVDVLGFGYRRIDLGREIPQGSDAVRLQFIKPAWRDAKVETRLIVTGQAAEPRHDADAVRARLHEVARVLPMDCAPEVAVAAARAAGIAYVGVDLGVSAPHCDDAGRKTRPVRVSRADFRALRDAQVSLAHKEECRRHGGASPPKGRGKAHEAMPKAPRGGVGERAGGSFRSKKAQRRLDEIRRICARGTNRSRTRACQDAAFTMRAEPMLVATEPRRMVKPLYAKGGPAEARAEREKGETAGDVKAPARPALPRWFTPAAQRAVRRNLHATRFAYRLDRLGTLCLGLGAVMAQVAHEGTTATCPRCLRFAPKPLSERWHRCPCGLETQRDRASAVVILGRGILSFRDGPDPGGTVAKRREDERKAGERRDRRRAAMAAGAERARKARAAAAADTAGTAPPTPGRGAPGPSGVSARKRARGQGRNVGRRLPKA